MAQPQLAPGTPETPDLSPTGGRSELLPQRSRTPDTDGLRSGGNVVLVGSNEPFWDEQEQTAQVLRPAMSGEGRRGLVGYGSRHIDQTHWLIDANPGIPAGDYRTDIDVSAVASVYQSPETREAGKLVAERDYFDGGQ